MFLRVLRKGRSRVEQTSGHSGGAVFLNGNRTLEAGNLSSNKAGIRDYAKRIEYRSCRCGIRSVGIDDCYLKRNDQGRRFFCMKEIEEAGSIKILKFEK